MPRITFYPVGFSASDLAKMPRKRGNYGLDCSMADIVRSAITVGRASWRRVFQYGNYSAFEAIYRSSMVYANLYQTSKKFKQTDAYRGLDPSEKGAVSYFLALSCAKLFAERLLRVPWLMHFDVYGKRVSLKLGAKSRPDLIGLDRSRCWIAMEAKGRSNNADAKTKRKAKQQVRNLKSINGLAPTLRVGLISYFTSYRDLVIHLEDPPSNDTEGITLEIGERQYLLDYYRMFRDLVDSSYGRPSEEHRENQRTYLAKYITEMDFWVGIDKALYSAVVKTPDHLSVSSVLNLLPGFPELPHGAKANQLPPATNQRGARGDQDIQTSVGLDGIFVGLGPAWRKQPQES